MDVIDNGKSIIHKKFSSLFSGLGKMSDEYEIRLKPDAEPHAFLQHDMYLYL